MTFLAICFIPYRNCVQFVSVYSCLLSLSLSIVSLIIIIINCVLQKRLQAFISLTTNAEHIVQCLKCA